MTTISQQINELARSDNEECRLIISESMSPLQVQQAVAEIHTKFVGKKFRHLTLVYQGAMAEQTTVTPEILSALLLLNLPTLQTITVSGASVERSDELLDMLQQNYAVQSLKLTTSDKSLSDAITKMVRRNHQLCALERSDLMRKRGHQWRLLLRFPQWAALGLGTTLFSFVPLAAVILVAPWMTPAWLAAALVLTIVGGLHSAVSGLNMVFHARHSMLVDQWVAAMDERALNPSHLKQISVTLTAEQIRQYNQLITALQKVGNLKIPPLSQPAEQSAALSLSQQQAQHVMLVLQYAHPDFENGITSLPMESVEQLLLLTRQCGYGDSRLQPISLFQKPKNLRGVALVPHTLMPLVYKSFTSFGSYGEVFGNPFRAFSAYWKAGVGIDAQGQFRSWFGGPRKARIFFDTNSACEALRNNSVVNMALMISTSEELQALGRAAFDNSSLKKLTLHFKNRVTVADAEQLALILRRQDLMLHKLYLPDAQFETGAVEILDAALRVNGNLHQLKNDQLAGHSSIQRSLARNRAILSADEQKVRSHNIAVAIRNRWLLKVGLPLSILVTLAAATVFVLFCPPLYPIVGIGGMIFYAVYGSVLLELALVAILLGVAEALDFSPSRSANNNLMSARAKEQADTTKTVTMLLSADQQKSAVEMMAKTKDTQSSARNSIESQPSMIGNTPFWKACVSPAMFSLLAVKRSTEVLRDQLWQRTPPPSNMIWQCPISPSADNEIETALSRFTDTETAAQTYAVSMGRV